MIFQSSSAQDRVFPLKGVQGTGKIVERTRDKVVIEKGGANQSYETNNISRVVFDGEPQLLSRAKDEVGQGQLDQAMEDFAKVDFPSIKSEDIKQDYLFFKGYIDALNALRGRGDPRAASKLLFSWAKDNSTSHLFYLASETLGELAMASGTPELASRYFSVLSGSPFADLKTKGNYLSGKALLASKKPVDARAKFDLVAQAQVGDPASLKFKKLASLASIRCDAAEGKGKQALDALEKMVDEGDSTDSELFSEIFNAIGGILRASGNNDESVLAYLKTDLLYATEVEAHAEALYNLSQLWALIGDNQRATETKSRLSKLYPTSPWLTK